MSKRWEERIITDEIYERIVAKYYKELKNNYEFLRERGVQV